MTGKKKFHQQRLWVQPLAPGGLDLPATKQQELRAALADLLWQFARASADLETTTEQGGYDGHAEPHQDHA